MVHQEVVLVAHDLGIMLSQGGQLGLGEACSPPSASAAFVHQPGHALENMSASEEVRRVWMTTT
eukprot:5247841-Amphidinium_carterae.2